MSKRVRSLSAGGPMTFYARRRATADAEEARHARDPVDPFTRQIRRGGYGGSDGMEVFPRHRDPSQGFRVATFTRDKYYDEFKGSHSRFINRSGLESVFIKPILPPADSQRVRGLDQIYHVVDVPATPDGEQPKIVEEVIPLNYAPLAWICDEVEEMAALFADTMSPL